MIKMDDDNHLGPC